MTPSHRSPRGSGRPRLDTPADVGVTFDVVAVPPGRVALADRRTEHRWTVALDGCLIGTTPVTQGAYADVTGKRPSSARGDQLPVETVSWWDAVAFCNTAAERDGLRPAYEIVREHEHVRWDRSADGWRLPSEAEWEHACRAGTSGPRYGTLDDIALYRANSDDQPHEVAAKRPNGWGLHDMLGNVWEWCWDLYDPQVYGTYRVLRGGGWADEPWSCRAGVRRRSHPTFRIDDVGFRVCRSPDA